MARKRDPGEPAANDTAPMVESTTLSRVSYSPAGGRGGDGSGGRGILRLTFKTGKIYDYFDVPPRIHAGLMRAESKGRYFNRHIRPRFIYRRVR